MPLSDFRDTFSWREAIDMGPELVSLSEQLPATEELGLSYRIHKAIVDLPAAIAWDLLEGDSYTRKHEIAKLAAMLDLIDRVYPALDTAKAHTQLEQLSDRLGGERFGEQTPGAAKAHLPGATSHLRPQPEAVMPNIATPETPQPHLAAAPEPARPAEPAPDDEADPSTVPVVPEIDEPDRNAAAPTHVAVEPAPHED